MRVKGKIRKSRRFFTLFATISLTLAIAVSASGDDIAGAANATTQPASDVSTSQTPFPYLTGGLFGLRQKLLDRGIAFSADIIVDGSKNLQGGLDTAGTEWRHIFEFTSTIDTKPLIGLGGGTVFVDFQNQSGRNASQTLVGDIQVFDNIDADGRTQLAQLWYQQILFNGVVRIKAGKVDAISEFDKSANAGEFLNSSAGYSATLFTVPTYPNPATAVNIFLQPGGGFYGGAGVYDGSLARGIRTGENGPKTFFHDWHDLFLIAEVGRKWGTKDGELAGRLGVGGYYNSNRFSRLAGGRLTGASGFFALFDQMLYRPVDATSSDNRGIGMFVMTGTADSAISTMDFHFGTGVTWTGVFPHRDRDVMGVSLQAVHLSKDAGLKSDHEVAVESFYRFQITPWAMLKPDVQYIASPGGQRRDAVVTTLRCEVDF